MTRNAIEVLASASCELSPTSRLLLLTIEAKAAARGGEVDAYKTDVAAWTGFDRRTIDRVLPQLIEAGWLAMREQQPPRPPLYRLGPRFEEEEETKPAPVATSGGGAAPAPAPGGNVLRFPSAAKTPPPERETAPLSASARVYTRADASPNAHSPHDCAAVPAASGLDFPQLTAAALEGFRAARLDVHGATFAGGGKAPEIALRVFGRPAAEVLLAAGRDVTAAAVSELSTVGAAWWMRNVPGKDGALDKAKHAIGLLAQDDGRDAEAIRDAMAAHLAPKVTTAPPAITPADSPEEQEAASIERRRKLAALGMAVPDAPPRLRAGGSR